MSQSSQGTLLWWGLDEEVSRQLLRTILKHRSDRVAKRSLNPLEECVDIARRSKLRVPCRVMPQVKPPDLGKAVGIRIGGFELGAGTRLTRENSAAVGFPAPVDRTRRARLIQEQGVNLHRQTRLLQHLALHTLLRRLARLDAVTENLPIAATADT